MVNLELLNGIIKESGMTKVAIADKSGIPRPTLYNRLAGKSDITVDEMVGLVKALKLTARQRDQIFLS